MAGLEGRIALVTGGATGIGRGVALALASRGARVVVAYHRSAAQANEVVEQIRGVGQSAIAVQADLSNPPEAASLIKTAEDHFGAIGILVNNAGVSNPKSVDTVEARDWEDSLRVNLSSAFYVTQAALPGMRKQRWGRIIMMSSVAAQDGGIIGPHYAASKAGLLGLARSYARQLAPEGITVNAITPALIDTEMVRSNPHARPDLVPVGRFGTVEEVASLVVTLVSSGYITGQTIGINGGRYIT